MSAIINTLPTPRDEAWKYTNLKNWQDYDFAAAHDTGAPHITIAGSATLPAGVTVQRAPAPPQPQPQHNFFTALNAKNNADAWHITIADNTQLTAPLVITHDANNAQPRFVIALGRHAHVTLVEYYRDAALPARAMRNQVTSIDCAAGAQLHHYRLQNEPTTQLHINHVAARVARDAQYHHFTLSTGAVLARNAIHIELAEPNAECHINAATLLRGSQHNDISSHIVHAAPHCNSRQTVKTVLDGRATAVFQGKIHVHQIAQKTDGYQMNQSLLLSPTAEMNSKPELEIYADDVKCSHGATTGQLDTRALFYLRSRGISETAARAMLVEAFMVEALDLITNDTVRAEFIDHARAALHHHD